LTLQELGELGLVFYNSLFMIVPAALIAWFSGEFQLVSCNENFPCLEECKLALVWDKNDPLTLVC